MSERGDVQRRRCEAGLPNLGDRVSPIGRNWHARPGRMGPRRQMSLRPLGDQPPLDVGQQPFQPDKPQARCRSTALMQLEDQSSGVGRQADKGGMKPFDPGFKDDQQLSQPLRADDATYFAKSLRVDTARVYDRWVVHGSEKFIRGKRCVGI